MYFHALILALALSQVGGMIENTLPSIWTGVEVAVVPHHMLTRVKVDEFYRFLERKYPDPDRIVLISPNHFNFGSLSLESTESPAPICFHGNCVPGVPFPSFRTESSIFPLFQSGVTKEHGIGEHFIFIAKYFPRTSVMPVVVRRKLRINHEEEEVAHVIASLTGKTLVLTSVDFSHHVDEEFARFHDMFAVDVLKNGSMADFAKLEVDCRNCLAIAKFVAQKIGKHDFTLFARTSVDSLMNMRSGTGNTSHIFGTFTQRGGESATGVFAFVGDTHIARGIEEYDQKKPTFLPRIFRDFYQEKNMSGSLVAKYHRIGVGFDYFIANLETAFMTGECNTRGQGIILRMKRENIEKLTQYGMNMFNLANNHSNDCGVENIAGMHTWLRENGIPTFGDASDTEEYIWTGTIRGERFAMIGANAIEAPIDWEKKMTNIRTLTDSGYLVIANFHWGVEYKTEESPLQREMAHRAVDAGARLVIGHHPHVVQGQEIYKGIPIYYSLGNFLFDQDFPETLPGLMVMCEVSRRATHCEDAPFTREKNTFAIRFE